ncbi:hypothetical protein ACYOEI_21185 [Singulisphaera rosea]
MRVYGLGVEDTFQTNLPAALAHSTSTAKSDKAAGAGTPADNALTSS